MHMAKHTFSDRLLVDQAQQQADESLACPAFVRGKVTRPMVQKVAGSGVYYRVSILCECENQIQIYYPPFETEPALREWVFRTSDRIHRASNGKWSYVGKGGWKFNVSSKGRKKRRTNRGAVAIESERDVDNSGRGPNAVRCDAHTAEACSNDLSHSESSRGTHSCGSKTGSSGAVAVWFDSHIRARRTLARQEGDPLVALGPAMSVSVRSQLGSSADMQPKPSSSGGQCATSACQADATLRSRPAEASPHGSAPHGAAPEAWAGQARVKQAVLSVLERKVDGNNAATHVESMALKGTCAQALHDSPGGEDSRRSSSTLEVNGIDSRAVSQAC